MSVNGEKIFQQRPSLSFNSCPVLSSSLSHMSSPSSHGNTLSTIERERRFNSFCQEPVCKKQCFKGNQTKRTFGGIKSSKSIHNIHQIFRTPSLRQQENVKFKLYEQSSIERQSLIKKKSKSFPTLKKEAANKWECIAHLPFDDSTLEDKSLTF